ncbi:MAG: metal-sensitive transcriptional regulator [Longimicrobiales bacterium]|nr:metal-sensitive transcriptional regulator [Longimicrobiales bacterium]
MSAPSPPSRPHPHPHHEAPASERHAVGVDPESKARNLSRLRRIEGQVRGLQRMVEEDRYCPDILTQVAAAQAALRGVARELTRNHLKHCTTAAFEAGDGTADEVIDELVELMYAKLR